jgi:hypothetical protein
MQLVHNITLSVDVNFELKKVDFNFDVLCLYIR